MGAMLGFCLGAGLCLMWSAVAWPSAARTAARPGRLRRRLDDAGLHGVAVSTLRGASAVLALVTLVALQAVSGAFPVALSFAVMAGYAPLALVAARARSRRRELAEVWPDAVDNLASAVRAGLSLAEALTGLGHRGPEPLRAPFVAFGRDYEATGSFDRSLDRLKARLADPVGDRVVEGLRVAREVGGGDLGRLLRNLSGHLRDDARTRAELEARQSWAVNSARLAVAAPWLVLLTMCFQPEVVGRFASTAGVVVLAVGGATCVVAYRLMVHIGRLPAEQRVMA